MRGRARTTSSLTLPSYFSLCPTTVDPTHFFSALEAELRRDSGRPQSRAKHDWSATDGASAAVRAAYFLLVSVVSRHRSDAVAEEEYRKYALRFIDAAMAERPTQHLVTALLLMSLTHVFGLSGSGFDGGSTFARLALSVSGGVHGLSIEIGATVEIFAQCTTALRFAAEVEWPPLQNPIGASVVSRATSLVSFIGMHLAGYVDVAPEHTVTTALQRRLTVVMKSDTFLS